MKSYSDLEQSKKLAKILPFESADMSWKLVSYGDEAGSRHEPSLATYNTVSFFRDRIFPKDSTIPCWSLAALLSVLPSGYVIVKNYHGFYYVESRDHSKVTNIFNNPIDACVAMIIELHKFNLL